MLPKSVPLVRDCDVNSENHEINGRPGDFDEFAIEGAIWILFNT